jgi:hypothetical protein
LTLLEEKIKRCLEAAAKNKVSYKIGWTAADQVMRACEETQL